MTMYHCDGRCGDEECLYKTTNAGRLGGHVGNGKKARGAFRIGRATLIHRAKARKAETIRSLGGLPTVEIPPPRNAQEPMQLLGGRDPFSGLVSHGEVLTTFTGMRRPSNPFPLGASLAERPLAMLMGQIAFHVDEVRRIADEIRRRIG